MSEFYVGGYAFRDENRAVLLANSTPFALEPGAYAAPNEIDHRDWLSVENQGSQGACAGHAMSTCGEICNRIKTGETVQLSREFAYLAGQKRCGLFGADRGATISGVVDAARLDGMCLEETFPYPGRYVTSIPQKCYPEAAEHRIGLYAPMLSYQNAFDFLAGGVGAIIIGVQWVSSLSQTKGVIEYLSGSSVGGHSVGLVGYSNRTDKQGRKYLWLVNSWGKTWGNQGWAEVAPSVIEQWCQREVVIGVSDLQEFGYRALPSWEGMTS